MDAIKFIADCIRKEEQAKKEMEKQATKDDNKKASVKETIGAVNPKANEPKAKSDDEPKSDDANSEPDNPSDNSNEPTPSDEGDTKTKE